MPLLVLFSCAMENKKGLIVFDRGQNGGGGAWINQQNILEIYKFLLSMVHICRK